MWFFFSKILHFFCTFQIYTVFWDIVKKPASSITRSRFTPRWIIFSLSLLLRQYSSTVKNFIQLEVWMSMFTLSRCDWIRNQLWRHQMSEMPRRFSTSRKSIIHRIWLEMFWLRIQGMYIVVIVVYRLNQMPKKNKKKMAKDFRLPKNCKIMFQICMLYKLSNH